MTRRRRAHPNWLQGPSGRSGRASPEDSCPAATRERQRLMIATDEIGHKFLRKPKSYTCTLASAVAGASDTNNCLTLKPALPASSRTAISTMSVSD